MVRAEPGDVVPVQHHVGVRVLKVHNRMDVGTVFLNAPYVAQLVYSHEIHFLRRQNFDCARVKAIRPSNSIQSGNCAFAAGPSLKRSGRPSTTPMAQAFGSSSWYQVIASTPLQKSRARRISAASRGFATAILTPTCMGPCFSNSELLPQGG